MPPPPPKKKKKNKEKKPHQSPHPWPLRASNSSRSVSIHDVIIDCLVSHMSCNMHVCLFCFVFVLFSDFIIVLWDNNDFYGLLLRTVRAFPWHWEIGWYQTTTKYNNTQTVYMSWGILSNPTRLVDTLVDSPISNRVGQNVNVVEFLPQYIHS